MNAPGKTVRRWLRGCWYGIGMGATFGICGCGLPIPADEAEPTVPPTAAAGRVLPVNTVTAEKSDSYFEKRSYAGIIRAPRNAELRFSRPGRLLVLHAKPGDKTRAGETLAQQDTREMRQQLEILERARTAADEELARRIGDSRLRSMESIRREVQSLRSELNQIREQFQSAVREDATDRGQDQAARLNAAQQRLEVLEATTADPQVRAQRAAIAELDQQRAELELALEQSLLVAPFDGWVASQYVSAGVTVSPQVPIMQIIGSGAAQAWIGIPPDVADEISRDETFTIQVGDTGAAENEFKARLLAKSPELDRTTRTRTVMFELQGSEATRVLPGEVARIELERERLDAGFWLPITALTRQSRGLWSVYVVRGSAGADQVVSRCYVEVMHLEGELARVRGTLDDGDLVIADGTHRVVPGQRVEPVGRSDGDL